MSPEAYELHDARFIQEFSITSAANALGVWGPNVLPGKVWTILAASYVPSVAETRTVYYAIRSYGGVSYPVTMSVSIPLPPGLFPIVTMGMELRIYPGFQLAVFRDAATALSTMTLRVLYIETDLPYYRYEDPLKKVIAQSQKHGSLVRGGGGGGGVGGGGGRPPGGGGGGPKPI
jgi:uncharacterized membrane protein YgcG